MYQRILVPVDGSTAATLGLQEAIRLAHDQQAQLRIVHIVDEAPLAQYPEAVGSTSALVDAFVADGRKTLDAAMQLARDQGIVPECALHQKLMGPLSDLILKEAQEWRADLIVLGTHGNTGLKHLLLRSTAEDIARSSRLPVLLVHAPPEPPRKS